jgi:putative SOS response-associated peptidase YedK
LCGRYSLNLESSQSEFKPETIINNKEIFSFNNLDISPSSLSPIIFRNEKKYDFEISRWGLSFDWLPKGRVLFNIRSETINQKSFSKEIYKNQRCIIPFSSYFEWRADEENNKKKYKIFSKDKISYFGGIYLQNEVHKCFSIITTTSRDNIAHIHKRNPLIIAKNKITRWLSTEYDEFLSNKDVELIFKILR